MRFIKDLKRYGPYVYYAAKCDLKSEVANSRLNWLWWILDPLCFMLVYIFVALVVFRRGEPYFPVFVFIGLTVWNFFSKTASSSVTLVKANRNIVTRIYIPRYMLLIQRMLVNGFKMLVSFALVAILMLIYRVPLSPKILYVLPMLLILFLVSFGVGSILMHFGVFLEDLSNVVGVLLRLMTYLSGIFYSVRTRVPTPFNLLLVYGNPVAYCMDSAREAALYQRTPNLYFLVFWLAGGFALSAIGLRLIYRYENSYAKVM